MLSFFSANWLMTSEMLQLSHACKRPIRIECSQPIGPVNDPAGIRHIPQRPKTKPIFSLLARRGEARRGEARRTPFLMLMCVVLLVFFILFIYASLFFRLRRLDSKWRKAKGIRQAPKRAHHIIHDLLDGKLWMSPVGAAAARPTVYEAARRMKSLSFK